MAISQKLILPLTKVGQNNLQAKVLCFQVYLPQKGGAVQEEE